MQAYARDTPGVFPRARVSVGIAALLSLSASVLASASDWYPLEPPDTSSPRATLQSFLGTMQEASQIHLQLMDSYRRRPGFASSASEREQFDRLSTLVERAGRCLDLTGVAPALADRVRLESVLLLKEIFDRIDLAAPESVPDAEAMARAELDRWRIPHTDIVIAKVKEGEHAGEFLFSPATLERLGEYYEHVRSLPYKPGSWEGLHEFFTTSGVHRYIPWQLTERLPAWAKAQVLGQALWRWIVLAIALIVSIAALLAISRWSKRTSDDRAVRRHLRRMILPVSVGVLASLLRFLVSAINVTGTARNVIATLLGAVLVLAAAWIVLLLANIAGEAIAGSQKVRPHSIDSAVARLGMRVLGFALAVTVTLYGAQLLGLPVVPLLAGLGVGGLAVALAAQPTIENFIAGLTLYADRPVRVGDFCRFGDTVGTIEQIGLRSTRIRTLDNTVVSVPNGEFSKARLENYSKRERLWYHPRIRLRYETTPDQVRFILVEIHKVLYAHPKVIPDPARVRFVAFGEYSLELDVFAYINVTDYGEYLEVAEDLNLRIMDVVKAAGSELSVPARIEYQIAKEPMSEDRTRHAETQVKQWRTDHALYVPRFPPEKIAELRGSLEYPPAGAPAHKPGYK
jgi:MscS family membrane protein